MVAIESVPDILGPPWWRKWCWAIWLLCFGVLFCDIVNIVVWVWVGES